MGYSLFGVLIGAATGKPLDGRVSRDFEALGKLAVIIGIDLQEEEVTGVWRA